MPVAQFDAAPYDASTLKEVLGKYSHNGLLDASTKSHLAYLDEYLRDVGAKTIVYEYPYTDRDYLEDYAAYYARCHEGYGRRCARLHFFGTNFDRAVVDDAIQGDENAVTQLQQRYLGFIVVKPLPSTVIGRTCLVTYEGNRDYPTRRAYKVHLFGVELTVWSLAFQEQDRDVAACATSALWSVFNKTGQLFQHTIPSPAEITNAAAESRRGMSRALPAGSGLTAEQIADAIRSVGLEPGYITAENTDLLLISACAYLKAEIPAILLGSLEKTKGKSTEVLGLHAVALAGYSRPNGAASLYSSTLFSATSTATLYSHDDQVGPFSTMAIDRVKHPGLLMMSATTRPGVRFRPKTLLVPLYHKIRVPIESVISAIAALNKWMLGTRERFAAPDEPLVWDIQLTSNADFKKKVHEDKAISPNFRRKTLIEDLPRYMWQVNASSGGRRLFDLMFDATDLLQGGHVTGGIPYSKEACLRVASMARNNKLYGRMTASANRTLENRVLEMAVKWFKDNAQEFEHAM